MSDNNTVVDLSAPEFAPDLTPEQIAEAGEKKKYVDDGTYYLKITEPSIQYSKPKLKNGELNADAKGAIWLNFSLEPLRPDGSASRKLPKIQYSKVFFYERLNKAAMEKIGYTSEQIQKVLAMSLPETYEMFRGFAKAMRPDDFGSYAKWDKETKTWTYEGKVISEEQAKAIKEEEKVKVLAFQKELRATNGKIVDGKAAFWNVHYEKKGDEVSFFPTARYPSATVPRNKEGVVKEVIDPDAK